MSEVINSRMVKIKSLNLKNVELKVTLSALCNTLGLKPKEMQEGLMSAIDTKKNISYVRITCYKDRAPEFTPEKLPVSRVLKDLWLDRNSGALNKVEFQAQIKKLAESMLQEKTKINVLDINKILSQLQSTVKTFK